MKKLIFIFYLSINFANSQSNVLCNLYSDEIFNSKQNIEDLSIQIKDNAEVTKYIERLMTSVDLPMNFHVSECLSKKCKNNASAKMNKQGTRFIVYDKAWFNQIEKDSSNIRILTVLAHEIGHHLSAHTLGLNYTNYADAIKYCSKRSPSKNQKVCDSLYKSDFEDYLYKQRIKELQADRFSGYIMNKYGANLNEIQAFFKEVLIEKDDKNSTHPRLSRRLKAINEGYLLAEQNKNSQNKIDIDKIKGNPVDIVITKVDEFKKYQTIWKIRNIFSNNIWLKIDQKLEYRTTIHNHYFTQEDREKFGVYLGTNEYQNIIDNDVEYFYVGSTGIKFIYNEKIQFAIPFAFHIKNNILKVLIIDRNEIKVVYKSIFDDAQISYQEIESIFIELVTDGFQKAINEYEKN